MASRSSARVTQLISRSISSYWWMRKFRLAITLAHVTPSGARTPMRDNRLAASPSFIINESPASCRRSSAR